MVGRTHPAPTGARGEKRSRSYARRDLGQTGFGRGFNSPRLHLIRCRDRRGSPPASRWHISNDDISYYKVKPDGAADKAAAAGLTGMGRRAWILIALAVLIVVMLVAVIALSVADGPPASSSPGTSATSAAISADI